MNDQNYNVRQNEDGSASIIGVRNPATNQWHGLGKEDASQSESVLENTTTAQKNDASNQLVTLQQQFENAKTVPEKVKIRKEIMVLQQNSSQLQEANLDTNLSTLTEERVQSGLQVTPDTPSPNAIENTIAVPENNNFTPENTILGAQNNIDKIQTNSLADQITQLEQQLSDTKSIPQKNKIRKQINQLKS